MSIQSFINQLSKVKSTPLFDNIYYGKTVAAQHRRNNLRKYLEALQKHEVELLMVGEAPGHKGCALTGVPFTDVILGNFRSAKRDVSPNDVAHFS